MEEETKHEPTEDDDIENECKCCKLKASNILGLISHIEEAEKCYKVYGIDALNILKETAQSIISFENGESVEKRLPKEIIVQYQPDENESCHPVIEEGHSKLDLSKAKEIRTLPKGFYLMSSRPSHPSNFADIVESIVGMCLSSDGESIEIRTLMTRQEEDLHDLYCLMNVFHAIMAVCDADLCTLTNFKHSPFNLNNTGTNIVVLRNRYTTDLMEADGKMPEPPETTCIPDRTRETHFLSEAMTEAVPSTQLLNNDNLDFRDMAAIGMAIRVPNQSLNKFEIRPLFSVNMGEDCRLSMKTYGNILTHWYGSKENLNKAFCQLPCYASASNRFIYETYLDCLENLSQPPVQVKCRHCHKEFKYNPYLFREKNKFKHHETAHELHCRICNEEFDTLNAKIYHMRTHKKDNFPCSQCIFVGMQTLL